MVISPAANTTGIGVDAPVAWTHSQASRPNSMAEGGTKSRQDQRQGKIAPLSSSVAGSVEGRD